MTACCWKIGEDEFCPEDSEPGADFCAEHLQIALEEMYEDAGLLWADEDELLPFEDWDPGEL